jgi:hypothetical protein
VDRAAAARQAAVTAAVPVEETVAGAPGPVRRIAVLRCALGDYLMATPALAALRARFPEAELTLLEGPWHESFLAGRPGPVDRVPVVPYVDGLAGQPSGVPPADQVSAPGSRWRGRPVSPRPARRCAASTSGSGIGSHSRSIIFQFVDGQRRCRGHSGWWRGTVMVTVQRIPRRRRQREQVRLNSGS